MVDSSAAIFIVTDLIVCGLGPAGRALAHRARAHGISVLAFDPHPDRLWAATYAGWADELPDWIAPGTVAVEVPTPRAWGTRPFEIERRYVVFDNAALRDSLDLTDVTVVADTVVDIRRDATGSGTVRLASGDTATAARIVDARGVRRRPELAEQTAFGVLVPRQRWAEPLFMDWRLDNGAGATEPRSFLYAVPVSDNTFLLEETCLAGRPALGLPVLRDRLYARLRARGVALDGTEAVERVRFPVQGGRLGRDRFGTAGGFLHPATGYSVTAALAAADAAATGVSIRPWRARAVHTLREVGLRSLLTLSPTEIPLFFDAFFTLPVARQRTYLSDRTDLAGTMATMGELFLAVPGPVRRKLIAAALPG
ncbi:lycopene cyclase family protein [Nocardia sp. alder85J]|uniref:lycopene cyclase family protein n=1 Tax=Nocardia sp. alder85J TaxID=2862949 RepID=UPI001CD215C7|nr:lycopene cyclase family protein [Nocardia sp. alder85J]MCX4091447.1 lycopene cyclase family protein [Nocardia sp. alder85J]